MSDPHIQAGGEAGAGEADSREAGSREIDVTVRMYNVGFGDCFLITVTRGEQSWRMLVDCGVHSQGRARIGGVARPIAEVVEEVVGDLAEAAPAGSPPRLDVVVATHHHQDHISGFAVDAWEAVEVGRVIVPFVENADDPDARQLRNALVDTATRLHGLIQATAGGDKEADGEKEGNWTTTLSLANAFDVNSMGNAEATDRLLNRNGRHFHNDPEIVYAPDPDASHNVIETTIPDVRIHILGPSRDPDQLKLMDPPASAQWLQANQPPVDEEASARPLFASLYQVEEDALPADLRKARASLRLTQLATADDELLGAAAVLERSVNNTSVYFVLDVAGTRLLFVGDSQEGAWEHVLGDAAARALVSNVAFYKIGHHGSHNATPKKFVESILGDGAYAMLPWGLVKKWQDTIPKAELLDALAQHGTHIIRADAPVAEPHRVDAAVIALHRLGIDMGDAAHPVDHPIGRDACLGVEHPLEAHIATLRRLRDLDDEQHVIRRQEAILGDRLAQQGGIASHDRRVVENEPTLCPHQSEVHFLGEVKYDTGLHGGMATHGRVHPFQFPVDQFDLHALERAALDHVQESGAVKRARVSGERRACWFTVAILL